MYCHHCGVKLHEGSEFCHSCGTKVAEPELQQPPITHAPINHTSQYSEPPKAKKGTAFIVIGWVAFGLTLVLCLYPTYVQIIFGLIALVMGILVINVRSQTHGIILSILAVVGALSSIGIGHAIKTAIYQSYYYF